LDLVIRDSFLSINKKSRARQLGFFYEPYFFSVYLIIAQPYSKGDVLVVIKKIENMKYFLTSIFSVLMLFTWAQSQVNMTPTSAWNTYNETSQLKIEYKVVDCTYNSNGLAQRNVLLRYTNKTSNQLDVSWYLELYFDGQCQNCNSSSSEYDFSITLAPNASFEGACDLQHRYNRKLFVKHTNLPNNSELTNFQLTNLQAISQ